MQGSHGTGQHPEHCQHHPQDADDAGEWGDHTIGGGTWPRDWYIYIYIYVYLWMCVRVGVCITCSLSSVGTLPEPAPEWFAAALA